MKGLWSGCPMISTFNKGNVPITGGFFLINGGITSISGKINNELVFQKIRKASI
jgi:hypothetical protein